MDVLEARVKLFLLDNQNNWNDLGVFLVRSDETFIEFYTEDTFECFDSFQLGPEQVFRQNHSVICLSDGKSKKYALSFQLVENTELFWQYFTQKLKENIPKNFLPFPSANNLAQILKTLINLENFSVIPEEWLDNLCESVLNNSSEKELFWIYFDIFKILINSKNFQIIEGLLKGSSFSAVFFILDKDPKKSFDLNFFEFFQEKVKFCNFLLIKYEKMIEDIHVAYRVLCLKDSLLSRSFSEDTVSCLKGLYCKKWDEILTAFKDSPEIIGELMKKLILNDENAFFFIQEIMKNCHFVNALTKSAIFDCFKTANYLKYMLIAFSSNPRTDFADILVETLRIILKDDPKIIFNLFSSSWEELSKLIMFSNSCSTRHLSNTFELLNDLITSDYLSLDSCFFCIFSEKILPFFISHLSRSDLKENFEFFQGILRLCSECIRSGICNLRYILISRDFNNLLLDVFRNGCKVMIAEVIQVIHAEIDNKNEFLLVNLIKSGVLLKVLECFCENSDKQNLIFSSIFSLIQKILKSGNEELTGYIEELISLKRFEELKNYFHWFFTEKENEEVKFSPDSEMTEDFLSSQEILNFPIPPTSVKPIKRVINDNDHPTKQQKLS